MDPADSRAEFDAAAELIADLYPAAAAVLRSHAAKPMRGQRSPDTVRRLAERDAAILQLAKRFFNDESLAAQADSIATLARRYDASGWRSDTHVSAMPPRYAGTPREFLYAAFQAYPGALGSRQVRRILAAAVGHEFSGIHGQQSLAR